ncbi:MAG: hypothetical protein ACRC5A_06205, partial [Enterobacteriaceae bacterium]
QLAQIKRDNSHTLSLLLNQGAVEEVSAEQLAACPASVRVHWGALSRPLFTLPSARAAKGLSRQPHGALNRCHHLWPEQDPVGFSQLIHQWLKTDDNASVGQNTASELCV